ncbi:hypothetical protein ACROYT_G015601 [Oculina patagonica]
MSQRQHIAKPKKVSKEETSAEQLDIFPSSPKRPRGASEVSSLGHVDPNYPCPFEKKEEEDVETEGDQETDALETCQLLDSPTDLASNSIPERQASNCPNP